MPAPPIAADDLPALGIDDMKRAVTALEPVLDDQRLILLIGNVKERTDTTWSQY
jgi:hypothetical protein